MKILNVNVGTTYPIYIANDLLQTNIFADYCKQLKKNLVIITDSHLVNSHGKNLQSSLAKHGLSADLLSFPAGEIYKTRETKQNLEDALLIKQYSRDTCLIALGGGVVSDLVGFVGATFCRGVPTIYVPTTLLAMVDASIGGKTAVNTVYGKNLIGSFYQPQAIFNDTSLLHSLPEKEWHNGVAEIIKYSVIADANFFAELKNNKIKFEKKDSSFLNHIIHTSCLIKKTIIEQDEKDTGMRQLLNFGHTIGHAIETVENYKISHGEAVAIGMLVESYISILCGFLQESSLQVLSDLLSAYHLPLQSNVFKHQDAIKKILLHDKKTIAKIPRFVLLDAIGKAHVENQLYSKDVSPDILNKALDWAYECFSKV